MPPFKIFTRFVYGRPMVYPLSQTAKQFADLMDVKTFNPSQLSKIAAMGYVIETGLDPLV